MIILGIIDSVRQNTPVPPVVVDPNAIKEIGVAEYAAVYLKNDGTPYTVTGNDNGYSVQPIPLSNILQVEGGQYTNLYLNTSGQVFSTLGNSLTVVSYPLDFDNQPFTCDYVQGLYKNVLALKDGELWYWSTNHPTYSPEDVLNQGYNGIKPKKLIQPAGKTLVKIVSASATTYGNLTYVLALASDGTVWKWGRNSTTPSQITGGWTGVVRDVALIGPHAYVLETTTGQLWGWGYNGYYIGAQSEWQNPNPQNITTLWSNAGVVFPTKQLAGAYNTLHIIDANNNLFAAGSNPQGNIGNGVQRTSWRTATNPYLFDWSNGNNMQTPIQVRGKWKKLCTNNTIAPYIWAQDIGDKWYSWGRNKGRVLGNGITLNVTDEATKSEFLNIPAPRKVTPLTQTWTVLPTQNVTTNRNPIAHAGVDQYLTSGTTSTTLYADYSHQQQPTNSVTVTMSYAWSQVSGPNTATIVTPNAISTNVTNLIDGTYIFRVLVTNSNGLTDTHETTVNIGAFSSNLAPIVNAGNDQQIYTPSTSTTLTGSATDNDGNIVSYLWTKDSGPSCTIVSPSSNTTSVTGLSVGVYVFRLTAVDNSSLSSYDTVTVTVASAPSGQSLIDVGGWNAYVKLPDDYHLNPTTYYPTIIFFPGLGEVGTDASKLLQAGPSAYIHNGWNGNVTVNSVVTKFIVISLQPPSSYPSAATMHTKIEALKSLYRIDNDKLHLTGLSHGGWCSTYYAVYYPTKVASVTSVQGVQPFNTVDYPTVFPNYINNGGRYLALEQIYDFRDMANLINAINAIVPGAGIYKQTNFGGGGHCCWNSFYGAGSAPSTFSGLDGNTENIYQWMSRQSL